MSFAEPWEAQVHALAILLGEPWRGAQETLEALERIADAEILAAHRQAWTRAAERTPHGTPIELTDADFQGVQR